MRKYSVVFFCVVILFSYAIINHAQGASEGSLGQDEISYTKKLFLKGNVALSEKRFADAHMIAKKLLLEYAEDPQIWLYMHFYIHTFYFLDKDFQKGMLRPTPPGIQKRIDELKAKENKTVIDVVTLAWVVDAEKGFSIEYLEEIIEKFPGSAWADWAKTELAFEKIPGKGTTTKERAEEFYKFGAAFMKTNPETHLMPRLLSITASARRVMSQDKEARDETIKMYQRILDNYPNAEYCCADARRELRRLLGESYKDPPGCSEENDRIITQFYCVLPDLGEYKKYTTQYVQMIEKRRAKTEPGLPLPSYLLITPLLAIAIAVLILLLKKSGRRHTKRFG